MIAYLERMIAYLERMIAYLERMLACDDAVAWCRTQPDLPTAWAACERPDWLLWLAGRTGAKHELLVLVACEIAETVLHMVPAGEDRPRLAIETSRAWMRGEASLDQVRMAAADADYAVWATTSATSAYAVWATTSAVLAYATGRYAVWAAYAAYAAWATTSAASDAARVEHCRIIRKHLTCPEIT